MPAARSSSGRGGSPGGRRGRRGDSSGPHFISKRRVEPYSAHASEDMSDDVTSFFGDLTGGRGPRRAPPPTEPTLATSKPSAYSIPGEIVPVPSGVSGQQTQDRIMWLELGLCKALVRAVTHLGFIAPTPVQAGAIPAVLRGADVCARAVTGSGKTAAFLLPIAHLLLSRPPLKHVGTNSKRRYIRSLIMVPTRELGVQCQAMLTLLLQFTTGLTVAVAIGGVAPSAQEAALDAAPDIVIATPGRLVDFAHNYKGGAGLDLSGVELVALDECDKMLTGTMRDQVVDVLNRVPAESRQVLLFSATMTKDVDEFAAEHLYSPKNIDIGHVALQSQLRQQFVRIELSPAETPPSGADEPPKAKRVRSKRLREAQAEPTPSSGESAAGMDGQWEHASIIKCRYLVALCKTYFDGKTMIFCRYRTTVHRLVLLFNALGLSAVEVQGNKEQEERFAALEAFATGQVRYLISTDAASRGLDIPDVATVINFDLPPTLTAYIHRVGRTARMGTTGTALSLVDEVKDAEIMRKILAVSGVINHLQVASVKRRDVPGVLLQQATAAIAEVFPIIRAQLAAEHLEERIVAAEKRYGRSDSFIDSLTPKPKREWCLSREERKRREAEARQQYEKEAEVTVNRFQNELNQLEREESNLLQVQRNVRREERKRKAREADKEKERRRELRKKRETRVQAGVVKRLKRKKLREAMREKRTERREKAGSQGPRRTTTKSRHVKPRHRRSVKKH